jgi:hypothetical protein
MQEDSMEQVKTIWNKGIAALCDRRFPDEFPDGVNYSPVPLLAGALVSRWLPDNVISQHQNGLQPQDGDVVWVRVSWLKSFVREVLPYLRGNITLVTGDSDSCIPAELGRLGEMILRTDCISHWYTQNYDGTIHSDRVSPIPIGVDFHMASEKPIWGEKIAAPFDQEKSLVDTSRSLPPLRMRSRKVYVDFGWQRRRGLRHYRLYVRLKGTTFHESRFRVAQLLKTNSAVHFQEGPLPRKEMWRKRGQYAFVLSPHGMGLDCHRTWEALALGHIVLVPSSSLDSVFEGLPVVPISSWSEINEANLDVWLDQYANFDGKNERLTSRYWLNKMRMKGMPALSLLSTGSGSVKK